MPESNPLLQYRDLPLWSEVRAEHIVPAITTLLADNRQIIAETITTQSVVPTWDDLVLAIDETDARLHEVLSIIDILSMTKHGDTTWQAQCAECKDAVAQYKFETANNRQLFEAYQRLANSSIALNFDDSRKAALRKILLKFRLAGIDLPALQQEQLARLDDNIDGLEALFLYHLDSANGAWKKHIEDVGVLEGLQPSTKDRLARLAREAGKDGWLIPLDRNTYQQIMRYAQNRALREEYFLAYYTRASDKGPHADQFDNEPVLTWLLEQRQQKARLLGFENFAQLRLTNAMAESTLEVSEFLRQQVLRVAPSLKRDTETFEAFALERGIEHAQAWDYEFLAEQMRQHRFPDALTDLRDYFPLDGTLLRLCLFSERLFGVSITEQREFSRWHDNVRLFTVSEHGQTLGHIYLDPFRRKGSPDFPWSGAPRNRRINAEGRPVLPIATLHSNLTPEADGKTCLLEFEDLQTLLHEFGHCLQQVLTDSPHFTLSGISQLGRDAAEFVGQVFERWCRVPEFLLWLGADHKSGERLTEARVEAVLAALDNQPGQSQAVSLLGALFDFELHRSQGDGRSVQQVFADVQSQVPHALLPADCRFANSFDYLVTGYEAATYAYVWSGVMAKEAFTRFEQEWVFNPQTGRAFREAFFSPGDSRSLMKSLEAFTGRPIGTDLFAMAPASAVS
jgi:oligopeptidase A